MAKKPKRSYSPGRMEKALFNVSKGMKFKTVARKYNVPRSTLIAKYEGKYSKSTMGPDPNLNEKYEKDLVTWIIENARRGFPVTREQLRDGVKMVVVNKKISNKFVNNKPGYTWVNLFMKRNPSIHIKKSQVQVKDRKKVTQQNIDSWAKEVREYIADNNLQEVIEDPVRVFNYDETAFFVAPSPGYVLAPRSESEYSQSQVTATKKTILS